MRVAVVYGGPSEERAVSVESGEAAVYALKQAGYEVRPVCIESTIDPFLEELRGWADVVFIALHGRYGEDGTIQKTLEAAGLSYTGSGPEASSAAMCKPVAKRMFQVGGVKTPKYVLVERTRLEGAAEALQKGGLAPPIVVKPAASGSSIGVSLVEGWEALQEAVMAAGELGGDVLVEEYIDGRELTVGILDGETLPVVEIAPRGRFFDFRAKYSDGMAEIICPAELDDATAASVQKVALQAFRALGARDFGRVDVILDRHGTPWTLEVNTIPGLTSHSLLPRAAAAKGLDMPALVSRIVELAYARAHTLEWR